MADEAGKRGPTEGLPMISGTMRPLREPTLRMAWLRLHMEFWHLINEIGWWIRNWGDDLRDLAWESGESAFQAYCREDEDLHKVVDLDSRRR